MNDLCKLFNYQYTSGVEWVYLSDLSYKWPLKSIWYYDNTV